ncbi:hypothetical protein [Haloferula sp.]|uniref:hypothetical protein n=1 Tax=Haloferula sp. TaxID=2497595 RepID=UPI0032A08C75
MSGKKRAFLLVGCVLVAGYAWIRSSSPREALPPGKQAIPSQRGLEWEDASGYEQEVLSFWSQRELGDWEGKGKVDEPRIILARLQSGTRIAETNDYLRTLTPWGEIGSTWLMNRKGDYDFSLTVLTSILWLYGDDGTRLEAATRDHLLQVLLTEDGGKMRPKVPRTLGVVDETENHLLMTEGSRYLKNRWLHEHGDTDGRYDNKSNGMEEALLAMLSELRGAGLHEFNSQPYIGYTIAALLNLEAFSSDTVRESARALLDQLNWKYALGSYKLRHYPPFRRRYEYASHPSLTFGYQTAYMKAWLSFGSGEIPSSKMNKAAATHALMGVCLPYRLPDEVVHRAFEKEEGYLARLGHGKGASPEVYSAGPGFLLSAGGVNRGKASQIVARPITLLLDDGATDLSEVFHLAGPGGDFKEWNNTGVHRRFACAAGPVRVPSNAKKLQSIDQWTIYQGAPGILVVVYSADDLGILTVLECEDSEGLLDQIAQLNSDPAQLRHSFQFPNGSRLGYDLNAPKDAWVMTSEDGETLGRKFDDWPLITID